MSSAKTTSNPESTIDSAQQVKVLQQNNAELTSQVKNLQKQLDVFKQMLFGKRSEKRPYDIPAQGVLFPSEASESDENNDEKLAKQKISYERGKAKKGRPENCVNAEGLRFDDQVPVKRITLTPPEIEGLSRRTNTRLSV